MKFIAYNEGEPLVVFDCQPVGFGTDEQRVSIQWNVLRATSIQMESYDLFCIGATQTALERLLRSDEPAFDEVRVTIE